MTHNIADQLPQANNPTLDIPEFLKVENREMDFEPEEGEMFLQTEDEVGSEDDDED